MTAPQILAWVAEAGGTFARVQLGGTLILGSSFILVLLVARQSITARISIRRAAVVAVLLLSAASVVTPWRWSVPVPSVVAPAVSVFGAGARWETEDRQMDPARGTDGRVPARAVGYASPEQERAFADQAGANLRGPTAPPFPAGERSRAPYIGSAIAAWAAGAAGILLYYLIGLVVLSRHACRGEDITDRISIPSTVRKRRRVRVRIGGPYRVPICFGLLRGTVLLPYGAWNWPAEKLRAVVLHELAHLESRDDRSLLRTRLVCALCWPNPLAWILSRALDRETDARCDGQVVRWGVSATAYARTLVELAVEGRPPAIGVAMHMGRRSSLSWRVKRLLDPPSPRTGSKGVAVAGLLLLLVGAAGASARIDPGSETVPGDAPSSAVVGEEATQVTSAPPRPSTAVPGDSDSSPMEAGSGSRPPAHGQPAVLSAPPPPLTTDRRGIVIAAAPDANAGNPVVVEIVAASSDAGVDAMMEFNAAMWFSRNPPTGDLIDEYRTVATAEIRPGTCTVIEVPERADAGSRGLFLFARYGTPGQHRVRLDWLRGRVLVELHQRGLNASDEAPGALTCAGLEPTAPTSEGDSEDLEVPSALRTIDDPNAEVLRDPHYCQWDFTSDAYSNPTNLPDAITSLLEDPDPRQRESAAHAILRLVRAGTPEGESSGSGRRVTKDHRHALTAGASDPDTEVRLVAICALGQVGDADALEVLGWRTAAREDARVQRAAAWATAQIRARIGLQP